MRNNREMEGPKNKKEINKIKKKKSRRGHVACRKVGGSFLLFKIRFRVIQKKKEKREKWRYFRVRSSHLSLDFPTIGP